MGVSTSNRTTESGLTQPFYRRPFPIRWIPAVESTQRMVVHLAAGTPFGIQENTVGTVRYNHLTAASCKLKRV